MTESNSKNKGEQNIHENAAATFVLLVFVQIVSVRKLVLFILESGKVII